MKTLEQEFRRVIDYSVEEELLNWKLKAGRPDGRMNRAVKSLRQMPGLERYLGDKMNRIR